MSDLLRDVTARLSAAGIDSARTEARILIGHAGGDTQALEKFIARRVAHERACLGELRWAFGSAPWAW